VPELLRFAELTDVNIAISLNATTNATRSALMPINRKFPIEELVAAGEVIASGRSRRITYEYVMFSGINDLKDDAERLIKLLVNTASKVNLIPYNENPNKPYITPPSGHVERFQNQLAKAGLLCTIRQPRGLDISAACGQLIGVR
jgi:23S rRNA (adenine2503-C2)-methyltransferase